MERGRKGVIGRLLGKKPKISPGEISSVESCFLNPANTFILAGLVENGPKSIYCDLFWLGSREKENGTCTQEQGPRLPMELMSCSRQCNIVLAAEGGGGWSGVDRVKKEKA